jgi:rhamnosyltransferase subunit B
MPLHVTLLPFGSAGDVLPFLWLGRQLRARGHEVTVVTSCIFAEAVTAAGLGFVPVGRAEDFERIMADPQLWKIGAGTKRVFQIAGEAAAHYIEAIEILATSACRPDLLLAPCTAFGARLARESLGIPLVTVHLQPSVFVSAHELPVLFPGMELLNRLPLWLRRGLVKLPNPVDRYTGPAVAALCRSRGLIPPRSLWWDWGNSPDGVLALFPEWFARPQPDWPQPLLQWDFPLEDLAAERPLDPDLLTFLEAGEAPVVFTPGSANVQARRFFEVALAAVRATGLRAVFVTRTLEQLPKDLPDSVQAVTYAPFSPLLRRAAAFVHHGGIGTLAQGFAAGLPQIVMPMAHDQPDNAHRLVRLGAGLSLPPRHFTPERLASALLACRENPALCAAAQSCAKRLHNRPDPGGLVDWLEARSLRQAGSGDL